MARNYKTPDFLVSKPRASAPAGKTGGPYKTPSFLKSRSEAVPTTDGAAQSSLEERRKRIQNAQSWSINKFGDSLKSLFDRNIDEGDLSAMLKEEAEDLPEMEEGMRVTQYIPAFSRAYKMATLNMEKGRIGQRVRYGKATPADMERIKAIDAEQGNIYAKLKGSPFEAKAFGTVAPFIANSAIEGGKGALIGAMLFGGGTALASFLGPQAAAAGPASPVTVPIAAGVGAKLGSALWATKDIAAIEQGSAYLEMIDMGIEPERAALFADIYAMGSAGAEVAQFKILRKLLPGGDKLAKTLLAKSLRKVLGNSTAARAGARMLGTAAKETGVETGQEFFGNVVKTMAAEFNDAVEGTGIAPQTAEQYWNELTKGLGETAATTFVGMGVAGAVPAAISSMVEGETPTQYAAELDKSGFRDIRKPEDEVTQPTPEDMATFDPVQTPVEEAPVQETPVKPVAKPPAPRPEPVAEAPTPRPKVEPTPKAEVEVPEVVTDVKSFSEMAGKYKDAPEINLTGDKIFKEPETETQKTAESPQISAKVMAEKMGLTEEKPIADIPDPVVPPKPEKPLPPEFTEDTPAAQEARQEAHFDKMREEEKFDWRMKLAEAKKKYDIPDKIQEKKIGWTDLKQPSVKLDDGSIAMAPIIQKDMALSKPEAHKDLTAAFDKLREKYGDRIVDEGFNIDGEYIPREYIEAKMINQNPTLTEKAKAAGTNKAYKEEMRKFRAAQRMQKRFKKKIENMRPATKADAAAFELVRGLINNRVRSFSNTHLGRHFDINELQQAAQQQAWMWFRTLTRAEVQGFAMGNWRLKKRVMGTLLSKDKGLVINALRNYVKNEEGKRQGKSRSQVEKEIESGEFTWNMPYVEDVDPREMVGPLDRSRTAKEKMEDYMETRYLRSMKERPDFPARVTPEDLPEGHASEQMKYQTQELPKPNREAIQAELERAKELTDEGELTETLISQAFRMVEIREKLGWTDEQFRDKLSEEAFDSIDQDEIFYWASIIEQGKRAAKAEGSGTTKTAIEKTIADLEKEYQKRKKQFFGRGEERQLPRKKTVVKKPRKKFAAKLGGRRIQGFSTVALAENELGKKIYLIDQEGAYWDALADGKSEDAAKLHAARETGRQIVQVNKSHFLVGDKPAAKITEAEDRKKLISQREEIDRQIAEASEEAAKLRGQKAEAQHQQEIEDLRVAMQAARRKIQSKIDKLASGKPETPKRKPRRKIIRPEEIKKVPELTRAQFNRLAAKRRKGLATPEEIALLKSMPKAIKKAREKAAAEPEVQEPEGMITLESMKQEESRIRAKKIMQTKFKLNQQGEGQIINDAAELIYGGVGKFTKKLVGNVQRINKKMTEWLSLTSRFKPMRAEKTGLAVKNIASSIESRMVLGTKQAQEFLDKVNKSFGKGKATRKEFGQIVVAAEDPLYLLQLPSELRNKIQPAAQWLRDFFRDAQKELKEAGIDVDFVKRKLFDLEAELGDTVELDKIRRLEKQMEMLRRMNFQHISAKIWAANRIKSIDKRYKREVDIDRAQAKLLSQVAVKRRAVSFHDLITKEKNPLPLEKINPFEIILSYSKSIGNDLALRDVYEAAKEEGLIKTTEAKPSKNKRFGEFGDWSKVPKRLRMLTDQKKRHTWISDLLLEAVDNSLTSTKPRTKFEKAMAITKMSQFYNPVFLPMYDVVQQNMAIPGALVRPGVMSRWVKANKMINRRDPEFIKAMKAGLASKPFAMPMEEMLDLSEKFMNKGTMGTMKAIAMPHLKQALNMKSGSILKSVYQASWNAAWSLDERVRFVTYLYLKEVKGMSTTEAAQMAAKFHGDYANIPPKTRRLLNKVLFTPTFKIAMGQLYLNVVKGVIKSAGGLRGTKVERQYAYGLLGLLTVNLAFHVFATKGLGLEEDEMGRRYYKRVGGNRGPKELVFTFSHPANMFFNYARRGWKIHKAIVGGEAAEPLKRTLEMFKWDVHPTWRYTYEMITNKDAAGEEIVSEFDPPEVKTGKWLWHTAKSFVGILDGALEMAGGTREQKRSAVSAVTDEYGKANQFLLNLISFSYLREPKTRRKAAAIRSKVRRFQQSQRRYARDYGGPNNKWIKQYKKQLRKLLKEIQ